MKIVRDIEPVRVPARTVHCIDGTKGLQVTVLSGLVWLTQANDRRDLILTRGQSFILDRKGLALVYSLKDAAILVGSAGHVSAADFAQLREWRTPA
ncbi:MAG TPA: DUF2917 domain-containing protein [Hyphomicrobiaceae bacterium]|nr:DUF2917 domain-containing protein [Hyphomicrobiaceae bacterium]